MTSSNREGFTLLEVMLGLAITAVVPLLYEISVTINSPTGGHLRLACKRAFYDEQQ